MVRSLGFLRTPARLGGGGGCYDHPPPSPAPAPVPAASESERNRLKARSSAIGPGITHVPSALPPPARVASAQRAFAQGTEQPSGRHTGAEGGISSEPNGDGNRAASDRLTENEGTLRFS